MGSQKISVQEAREVIDHLQKALTLLDMRGQTTIGAHVQMAIDLLSNHACIDETPKGSERHPC